MQRRTRTPTLHPLSRATAAVLIGLIVAPSLPASNPFAFDHTGQQEQTDLYSANAASVVSQGANAALDEVVSFVGDSDLPFLGSLQGGITYDHANGLLRYNLSTVGKLHGNGTGHHWLGQIGAHNEGDRDTANAGLIYRWIDIEKAWLIGTNLFYDHDFDTGAQRAGVGVEAATRQWRLFSNVYGGVSGKWRDAPGSDDVWEERVANGYDLGAAWSPGALPSLDLQLKASRWLGDAVDVSDNDVLHGDPLVWSAKVGYTPVPLLSLAFEQERVVHGDTNNRVDLQFTYRFGQSLAQQLEPSNVARRNDIAARALAPVERQHRIVMEQREKHLPLAFVGPPNIHVTLAAGQALSHALLVTGGFGAVVFSLEGRDAGRFRIDNDTLELAPEPATRGSLEVPAQPVAEVLEVIVIARDDRNREARQGFVVTREQKQIPMEGQAPVASALSMQGELIVGSLVTASYTYSDADDDAEGATRVQWYRASDAAGTQRTAIAGAIALTYTITADDVGQYLVVEILPVAATGTPADGLAIWRVSTTAAAEAPAPPQAPTMQAPTISGTVAVGATLTGTPQGFHDINGDGEGTHRYQWYRAADAAGTQRTPIDGANGLQFTITQADIGAWLVFEVIPVSLSEPFDGEAVRVVTGIAVAEPPQAPTMQAPTISGTVAVGATLTGTPQGFHDINGDAEGAHRYQWYRAADAAGTQRTPIDGATGLQFTITQADIGAWLVFEVIPVSLSEPFDGEAVSAVTEIAVAEPPQAPTMQAPMISGEIAVGSTLTGKPQGFHDINGDAEGTHRYQWSRATDAAGTQRTPIDGETSLQFTVTEADIGAWLVFEVIPVSLEAPFEGDAVRTVTASSVAEPPQAPTMQAPTISGDVFIGETLTGAPQGFHDINGDAEGTHRYQWYRATDAAGTQRTPIDGETGLQFTITEADVDAWLVFEVIPVSVVAPHDGDAVSAVTATAVTHWPQAPTMEAPAIAGHVGVGRTLTATPGSFHDINGDAPGTHVYQWYRASDAAGTSRVAIPGANGSQHTITDDDVGHWLIFGVTPVSVGAPTHGEEAWSAVGRAVPVPTAPTMTPPTLAGAEIVVGRQLQALPNGYHDEDGDPQGAPIYRWYRATDAAGTNRTLIEGADASTYDMVIADLHAFIVAGITPVSATGTPGIGDEVFRATDARVGVRYENETDVYMHDGFPTAFVYSDITVSGREGNGASNAAVHVKVVHPWRGDFRVRLHSPSGTVFHLKEFDHDEDPRSDFEHTFTLDLRGEPLNGTWTLALSDRYHNFPGQQYLDRWTISF